MKATKHDIADLRLNHFPAFADYLLSDKLTDFVKTLYGFSLELDIPLLKFFSGMEEKEIIRLSTEGNVMLLTAIKNQTISDYIDHSTSNWIKNRLPVITKMDVIGEDIALINFARKRAFRAHLAEYTSDLNLTLKILDEIDQFILTLESGLYKTYLSIQHEKLQASNDQLRKRENELLEAQALGKIGSFEWDLTGNRKSTFTPEVFKIFEFEKTSNLDAFLNDVHPEDRLKLRTAIEKAIHDGLYECEYRYTRNDKRKVLYSRGRVFFEKGQPTKMVGTVTDITEKANLIAQLTEHEELSKQAQALTNTGNWKWLIDSDTIEWSDEMYRIYGLEPQSEKITFQRFLTFIHDEDRNRRIEEITEAVKTGHASDYIMRINAHDGRDKVLKGKGRVIKDKFGKSVGMLGTCQDITNEFHLTSELRKKNEELVRMNKDLESFNFIASHDLQEPLRKIQIYSNRILHEGTDTIPENLLDYFRKISHASNRMQRMIEDFLVFYHLMSAKDNLEEISLVAVVNDALSSLGDTRTKDLQINVGSLPVVKGRRNQLTQMFMHLLSNAVKFRKAELPVEVNIHSKTEAKRSGEQFVIVSVSDNGIGFDEKYSSRIFELFQRLHGNDEYPGSGIGLTLCQKIAEDHQGYISVASNPGQGSTFHIHLPLP